MPTIPTTDVRDAVGFDPDLDPARARLWRGAVLALRETERRREFPTVVHVGVPGVDATTFTAPGATRWSLPERLDHALRCDVVAALLERHLRAGQSSEPSPLLWITRAGGLEQHDEDVAWLAAASSAYDAAGVSLAVAVITRAGWYDPRDLVGRSWRRLRRR